LKSSETEIKYQHEPALTTLDKSFKYLTLWLHPWRAAEMQSFDPARVADLRQCCRTIVDALEHLKIPDTGRKVVATIQAGEILCPNGQTPGMVLIGTGAAGNCDQRFARLPDSNTFRGRLTDGTPAGGSIHELNEATVGSDGTVALSDGCEIYSLELQPGVQYKHYDFTAWEDSIVLLALELLGEEDRCYRSVNEQLLPGVKWLDYTAIQSVRVPRVKQLITLIQKKTKPQISKAEIERILRLSGMQFPGPSWRPK
jgi:hypothetical protein